MILGIKIETIIVRVHVALETVRYSSLLIKCILTNCLYLTNQGILFSSRFNPDF